MKADHELRGLFCRQLHVNSSSCTRIRGYLQDIPLKGFATTGYEVPSVAIRASVGRAVARLIPLFAGVGDRS
jgi:hypothetical protein